MGFRDLLAATGENLGIEVPIEKRPVLFDVGDAGGINKSSVWPALYQTVKGLEKVPKDGDYRAFAQVYATIVWVYVCAWVISSSLGSLRLRVYTGPEDKPKEVTDPNDPVFKLLKRPNVFSSRSDFIEDLALMMDLTGNGFIELCDKIAGLPARMFVIESFYMEIIPDPTIKVRKYIYDIGMGNAYRKEFRPDEIAHFKYANPQSQYWGQGTVQALQTTCVTELYRQGYDKAFFEGEARPDVILKQVPDYEHGVPPIESDRTSLLRFVREWRQAFGGPRKTRLPVMMPPGLDINLLTEARQDMDFREMEKSLRERVFGAFGVPPAVGQVWSETHYANAKEQIRVFWTVTMPPKCRRIEGVINRDVLAPYDPEYWVKFDLTDIPALEEDTKERTDRVSQHVDRGLLSLGQAKEQLHYPIDPKDKYKDVRIINSSYVRLEDVVEAQTEFTEEGAGKVGEPKEGEEEMEAEETGAGEEKKTGEES